ncbi:SAM-dependent MidA family methyltransferase [Allocatelliglobosispora scoriae]|uniref:SAM-dependent MidA family methyltransferase n=1 Tax=Allocatelliglobosispora scoriae TaxID=643052 RepID=A0A841BX41_9ACTN|nr:SAM-dependent methyltransferase [Allocatelliglobosispora scoriae]MBB5871271.1 SAM-dependent MidA family methyltransferase [Allocatelliglobosispora scoriae]
MTIKAAMAGALYGPDGFFIRERPADHFRTSALASPLFAQAIATLIHSVAGLLPPTTPVTVVDVGAGRGELLTALLPLIRVDQGKTRRISDTPDGESSLDQREFRWVGVEVGRRPEGLDERIAWVADVPVGVTGVLLGCEWLDNVPLDLAEVDGFGTVRYRTVDGMGAPVRGDDADWLARWWPISEPGEVAEIGLSRDLAWADAVSRLDRGLAVAIDYGHRLAERPWGGTLTGFRGGREVEPRFDGSTDITAHVAMDSLVRPGDELITQREVFHRLGITGARPPIALASSEPLAYLRKLSAASAAAELTDPRGLGAHLWLLHQVGIQLGWAA